jgi:plastocyanin
MGRRRILVGLVALVAVAAGVMALGGVGAARSSKTKVVKVFDVDDGGFTPTSVKIHKNDKVKWKWQANFDVHNVTLKSAPKGVKKSKFRSQTSSSPTYRFTKKFKKPGKYHFICTIHPVEMQMDVKVRRPHHHHHR